MRQTIIDGFFALLEKYPGVSWVNQVAMRFQSNQSWVPYSWLGLFPRFKTACRTLTGNWIPGRHSSSFGIENRDWTAHISIDDSLISHNKTDQIMTLIDTLAQRTAALDSKLITNLLNSGEKDLCFDGKPFFSADHFRGKTRQSNNLAADACPALKVKQPLNPAADEMNAAILNAIQHLYTIVDDESEPVNSLAREFLVMVPNNLMVAVVSPDIYGSRIEVANNPWLTQKNSFFVFRIDAQTKPFIIQDEVPLKMGYIGHERETSEGEHVYGVTRTCGAGYGYWQYALKCSFSA